jgi:streptomycin 6-kinase
MQPTPDALPIGDAESGAALVDGNAHIPDNFARAMAEVHGAEGVAWVGRLPALVAECKRRWSITVGPPFEPLSYNYVALAERADGTRAVLKVGFPCGELMSEIEALRLCDGRGAVRLLEFDREPAALLLERLEPGTPLASVADDEEATAIAVQVMRQFWRTVPPEHPFRSLADWTAGLRRLRARFGGGTGPFPAARVEEAEALFAELLGSMAEPVLLHGDLHHENILAARRHPWLVIDPKGIVGEPAYETSTFLLNRVPDGPEAGRVLARRMDQLAEALEVDRGRIHGWAVAQAVLSAWWSFEDHGHGWEREIATADLLASLGA